MWCCQRTFVGSKRKPYRAGNEGVVTDWAIETSKRSKVPAPSDSMRRLHSTAASLQTVSIHPKNAATMRMQRPTESMLAQSTRENMANGRSAGWSISGSLPIISCCSTRDDSFDRKESPRTMTCTQMNESLKTTQPASCSLNFSQN